MTTQKQPEKSFIEQLADEISGSNIEPLFKMPSTTEVCKFAYNKMTQLQQKVLRRGENEEHSR
jgi:hypothetical protein